MYPYKRVNSDSDVSHEACVTRGPSTSVDMEVIYNIYVPMKLGI